MKEAISLILEKMAREKAISVRQLRADMIVAIHAAATSENQETRKRFPGVISTEADYQAGTVTVQAEQVIDKELLRLAVEAEDYHVTGYNMENEPC